MRATERFSVPGWGSLAQTPPQEVLRWTPLSIPFYLSWEGAPGQALYFFVQGPCFFVVQPVDKEVDLTRDALF